MLLNCGAGEDSFFFFLSIVNHPGKESESERHLVMYKYLQPRGLLQARTLLWVEYCQNSSRILHFPSPGDLPNPGLPHCRRTLHQLSHKGSPWRRLLRVPWTARRSDQSIRKEINPECSLEGLMLKLKLQYFGHLM